ncbi:MAG: AIPR family protein, partial [Flavipsychrobacter sp.]
MSENLISFDDYKSQWLEEILQNNPNTVQKGHRFAKKLITQWTDFSEDADDVILCDGSGDGGIDLACLQRGDAYEDNTNIGDTWYLIQSKYGSAFTGKSTLLIEAQKLIDTLDGKTARLSSLANDVIERIQTFRKQASEKDKIILVFATTESLTESEKRALSDIKALGKARLGELFDVDAVSIQTIYQRTLENPAQLKKYKLPITANLVPSGNDLLVGSVKLINLYSFLKNYKNETGDLDLIYEKNVRKFLGAGKKVNAGIATTLKDNPERFGLYNNGITIVVEDFKFIENDKYELTEPYIVNGCQTTRTIWDTLYKKLESGGTGQNPEVDEWKNKLSKGIVVAKIVKVGEDGNELLINTTRYTNSQNAVGQKDFIALEDDFRFLAKEMASTYNIFLEIQRGGWESQKVLQRNNITRKPFSDFANAFDLLKIYGAGWLREPGTAFGKNAPFAPG